MSAVMNGQLVSKTAVNTVKRRINSKLTARRLIASASRKNEYISSRFLNVYEYGHMARRQKTYTYGHISKMSKRVCLWAHELDEKYAC